MLGISFRPCSAAFTAVLMVGLVWSGVGCTRSQRVPFEAATWMAADDGRPIGMALDIVAEDALAGMSPEEVERMIGSPDATPFAPSEAEGGSLGLYEYRLERDWRLEVYFDSGRVVDVVVDEAADLM